MILHHHGLPADKQRSDQAAELPGEAGVALPADEQRLGNVHESPPAEKQRSVIEIELMQDWKRKQEQVPETPPAEKQRLVNVEL